MGSEMCIRDSSEGKKRFLCTVPGCTKKYKNINGIKYHVKNGHNKKETLTGEVKKNYLCHCGKAYKSQSGLRHHQNTQHNANGNSSTTSSTVTTITNTNTITKSFSSSGTFDARKVDHNFRLQNNKKSLPPVSEMCQPPTPLSTPEIAT